MIEQDRYLKNLVSKKKRKVMNTYLSAEERRKVIRLVGDSACLLFMAYLEKSGQEGFRFDDIPMGKYLGWKASKVKRLRLALTKADLFEQKSIADYKKGHKVVFTYLGRAISDEVLKTTRLTKVGDFNYD